MATRKSDEGANGNQPQMGHKRKWRQDHGGDDGYFEAYSPKKRSSSTPDPFKIESTQRSTPNIEISTPKRRGRKPGTKMPPKLKDKEKSACRCFTPHNSSYYCQIIIISEMITVFVGETKETFAIHKTLLILHSSLVRQYLSDGQGEDGKLTLPNIKPAMFADFVWWMYNGTFLQDAEEAKLEEEDACTQLWAMGALLIAPGFQNFYIDDYQTWYQKNPQSWPSATRIELIYNLATKGSLFRKFAAHSHMVWNDLLERCPELVKDMALMGKAWNGTVAWDDVNRFHYMVEEVPVDEPEDVIAKGKKRQTVVN
ncbi:hypothetical protein V8E51_013675 [Hyaloscypha variabilis]